MEHQKLSALTDCKEKVKAQRKETEGGEKKECIMSQEPREKRFFVIINIKFFRNE